MKTLYDYLTDSARGEGDEITVWDRDYDLEIYFYPDSMKSKDEWDKAMTAVAKKLTVIDESEDGVTVDLADVIEKKLDNGKFDYLFRVNTVDAIMEDIDRIFAGYVSTKWFTIFANSLI